MVLSPRSPAHQQVAFEQSQIENIERSERKRQAKAEEQRYWPNEQVNKEHKAQQQLQDWQLERQSHTGKPAEKPSANPSEPTPQQKKRPSNILQLLDKARTIKKPPRPDKFKHFDPPRPESEEDQFHKHRSVVAQERARREKAQQMDHRMTAADKRRMMAEGASQARGLEQVEVWKKRMSAEQEQQRLKKRALHDYGQALIECADSSRPPGSPSPAAMLPLETALAASTTTYGASAGKVIDQAGWSTTDITVLGSFLGAAGASEIAQAMMKAKQLRFLRLKSNMLGDVGVCKIASAVLGCPDIEILHIDANQAGNQAVSSLAKAVELQGKKSQLKTVSLSYNSVGEEGAASLGLMFKVNSSITECLLRVNELRDGGASALMVGLEKAGSGSSCCSLQHLDLSYNHIGDAGALAIAASLRTNKTIKILSLEGNRIGPEGGLNIASSLFYNGTLETLHLSGNPVGGQYDKRYFSEGRHLDAFQSNEPDYEAPFASSIGPLAEERVARRFVLVLRGGATEQTVLEGEAEEEMNPHSVYEQHLQEKEAEREAQELAAIEVELGMQQVSFKARMAKFEKRGVGASAGGHEGTVVSGDGDTVMHSKHRGRARGRLLEEQRVLQERHHQREAHKAQAWKQRRVKVGKRRRLQGWKPRNKSLVVLEMGDDCGVSIEATREIFEAMQTQADELEQARTRTRERAERLASVAAAAQKAKGDVKRPHDKGVGDGRGGRNDFGPRGTGGKRGALGQQEQEVDGEGERWWDAEWAAKKEALAQEGEGDASFVVEQIAARANPRPSIKRGGVSAGFLSVMMPLSPRLCQRADRQAVGGARKRAKPSSRGAGDSRHGGDDVDGANGDCVSAIIELVTSCDGATIDTDADECDSATATSHKRLTDTRPKSSPPVRKYGKEARAAAAAAAAAARVARRAVATTVSAAAKSKKSADGVAHSANNHEPARVLLTSPRPLSRLSDEYNDDPGRVPSPTLSLSSLSSLKPEEHAASFAPLSFTSSPRSHRQRSRSPRSRQDEAKREATRQEAAAVEAIESLSADTGVSFNHQPMDEDHGKGAISSHPFKLASSSAGSVSGCVGPSGSSPRAITCGTPTVRVAAMSTVELRQTISDQGLKHHDCASREALEQRALVAIKHHDFHEARRLRQEAAGGPSAISSPGVFGQRRQLKPAKFAAPERGGRGAKTQHEHQRNQELDDDHRDDDDGFLDDDICVPSNRRMIQNDCVPKGFSASEGCSVM
jgi:hypothetical protein